MILKDYEKLPEKMKNEKVKEYYDIISKKKISLVMKRIFDIFFSLVLLIILSPILLILAILIKIDSKGPVFYRQERVTTNGKIFRIFKFRTMVQNADKIGSLVTVGNDARITRVGKVIRKVRLDEIPQLINILKGEMTFVGTRPEVIKYVKKYSNEMNATLLMLAGITSETSIRYKDESKLLCKAENVDIVYVREILPEKMKYNLQSIKNFNFIEDLKTLFRTVLAVLGKDYNWESYWSNKEKI